MLGRTRLLIGGGAIATGLIAAAVLWVAPVASQAAEGPAAAAPLLMAHGGSDHNAEDRGLHRGGDRHWGDRRHGRKDRHGTRGGRGGHGIGAVCSRDMMPMTGFVASMVEHRIDMNEAQTTAWDEVKGALATAGGTMAAACDRLRSDRRAPEAAEGTGKTRPTTPERLARFEILLSAGLEAVQTVTPTVDRYYATLDQEQQKTFDRLLSRRQHDRKG